MPHPKGKDLLDLRDIDRETFRALLELARRQKDDPESYRAIPPLRGQTWACVFEKPSLRTRFSFEVAIRQLGGDCLFVDQSAPRLGVRESLKDWALVASRYVDGLILRTYAHDTITQIAAWATVPVINALSDVAHPCQALGDMLTLEEKLGALDQVRLAFVGDGNNVARSLAVACAHAGASFVLVGPRSRHLPRSFLDTLPPGARFAQTEDPREALPGASAIYTDVWTSMGQEEQAELRRQLFAPYQVNAALLAGAPHALILHCLPAHRGEEITDEVIDGPCSVVYDQAENRLHAQRAVLTLLASR